MNTALELFSSLSLDITMYKYSQFWFIDSEILPPVSEEYHILVIGCFEGLSSVYFADHYLEHPNSTLTCINPNHDYFDYNISICKNKDKITIVDSLIFDKTFNFIYVDSIPDIENAFRLLKKDGIMLIEEGNIDTLDCKILHLGYPMVITP
jgi:hypothetical protein